MTIYCDPVSLYVRQVADKAESSQTSWPVLGRRHLNDPRNAISSLSMNTLV